MKRHAIIVAGGSGSRMQSEVPKQFLELDGKPLIVHAIEKFLQIDGIQLVVVLPKDHTDSWEQVKSIFFADKKISIAIGGSTRTESVRSGLNLVDEGLVAIHDAVRPFASNEIIEQSFHSAEAFGSGVAAVKLKDSIRKVVPQSSEARDRDQYVIVQTPQTFRVSEIKDAYSKADGSFSDDATVFEKAGYQVKLIEGDYSNIKITTPEDLK